MNTKIKKIKNENKMNENKTPFVLFFFCKNKNYSIFLDTNIYIFGKIKNGKRMDRKL